MNKLYALLTGACTLLPFFTSCEKDLPVYNQEACGLRFEYEFDRDSVYGYSFAFGPDDVNIDTVEVEVALLGNVADYNRPIALRQVATGKNDAQPGVHYVPFDDPSLADKYILPANALSATIPVVVKRDPSLKQANYNLNITFGVNEAFSFTAKERAYRGITIADQLIQPNNWETYCVHFFGLYGPVKHKFMIEQTGARWDDEYVDNVIGAYMSDQNILFGMAKDLNKLVNEYNAAHPGAPLKEGPEYDNRLVIFERDR